jgi:antitoxin (DNA-binding transcriptional repressor) of toxin-antitoxin stability system
VRTVGLKILKNRLSEYVRLAAQGETVLVADRDRVVAELGPPRSTRAIEAADAHLADMVRRGVVAPALLPPGTRPRVPASQRTRTLAELLRELESDRADR